MTLRQEYQYQKRELKGSVRMNLKMINWLWEQVAKEKAKEEKKGEKKDERQGNLQDNRKQN